MMTGVDFDDVSGMSLLLMELHYIQTRCAIAGTNLLATMSSNPSTSSDSFYTSVVAAVVTTLLIMSSLHEVQEGKTATYKRGGHLINRTEPPGYSWKYPLIDTVLEVQHTMQTDNITNILCGTSGGVMVTFPRIEVVNILDQEFVLDISRNYTMEYDKLLIFDPVHALVNDWCSSRTLEQVYVSDFTEMDTFLKQGIETYINKHSRGLKIVDVRVTKPDIPPDIKLNYEELEKQKTSLAVEQARQKVTLQQAETIRKRALIEAEQAVDQEKAKQAISAIRDATKLATLKAEADAEFYAIRKQAEGNAMLLTPEYLELERYRSAMNNAKMHFFGQDIPAYLGSLGSSNVHDGDSATARAACTTD